MKQLTLHEQLVRRQAVEEAVEFRQFPTAIVPVDSYDVLTPLTRETGDESSGNESASEDDVTFTHGWTRINPNVQIRLTTLFDSNKRNSPVSADFDDTLSLISNPDEVARRKNRALASAISALSGQAVAMGAGPAATGALMAHAAAMEAGAAATGALTAHAAAMEEGTAATGALTADAAAIEAAAAATGALMDQTAPIDGCTVEDAQDPSAHSERIRQEIERNLFAKIVVPEVGPNVKIGNLLTVDEAKSKRIQYPWMTWDSSGKVFCHACKEIYQSEGNGSKTQGANRKTYSVGGTVWDNRKAMSTSLGGHPGSKRDSSGNTVSVHSRSVDELITRKKEHLGAHKETMKMVEKSNPIVDNFVKLVHAVGKSRLSFYNAEKLAPDFNVDPRLASRKLIAAGIDKFGHRIKTNIRVNIVSGKKRFSLIIDESTSKARKLMLNMFLRFVVNEKVENVFFDIVEVKRGDAQSIAQAIQRSLLEHGFTKEFISQYLIAVTADGASTMQGAFSGVIQRLRDWTGNQELVGWNCLIHQVELSVKGSVKKFTAMDDLKGLFAWVRSHYEHKPKNWNQLDMVARTNGLKVVKIGRMFDIRWTPSTYRAVCNMWSSLPAIVRHLVEQVHRNEGDVVELRNVIDRLTSKKFILSLGALLDITKIITITTEILQKPSMNIVDSNNMLEALARELVDLKTLPQKYIKAATEACEEGYFDGIRVHDGGEYRQLDHNALIDEIVKSILARIDQPSKNTWLILSMSMLTTERLRSYCMRGPELRHPKYGHHQYERIARHFKLDLPAIRFAFEYIIGAGIWDESRWPVAVKTVVQLNDIFSSTTAESERGFSEMNRVLTKDRTRLIARRLSSVMSVSLITPPVVQFKVSDALRQLFHQLIFPYLSSAPKSKAEPDTKEFYSFA